MFKHVLVVSARDYYDSLPYDERRSWRTTFGRLKAYFEPHATQLDNYSVYWSVKQGKSQSVEDYAELLLAKRRLLPKDAESEDALVFCFVENLANKEVARDVQNSYPRNMEEAVSP